MLNFGYLIHQSDNHDNLTSSLKIKIKNPKKIKNKKIKKNCQYSNKMLLEFFYDCMYSSQQFMAVLIHMTRPQTDGVPDHSFDV